MKNTSTELSAKVTPSLKSILFMSKVQNYFFLVVWGAIVTYLSYNILYEANWILRSDNSLFWNKTAIGQPFSIFSFYSIMRFIPLMFLDFNILLLFSDTPSAFAHYVWVTITFVLFALFFAYMMFCIEKDNSFSYSRLILPVFFVTIFFALGFMGIYIDVIYLERIIVLMFSIFLIFYYLAVKTDKISYYMYALPFAITATYLKEVVFGALLVLVLFNVIFYFKIMTKNAKIFYLLLALNSLIYLALFYFFVYLNATDNYAKGLMITSGYLEIIKAVFTRKILLVCLVVGIVRACFLLFRKGQQEHLFFDATLFAGLSYICAFIMLKMPASAYYFLPALVLIFPSLFYWVLKSYYVSKYLPAMFGVCLAFLIVFVYFERNEDYMTSCHTMRKEDFPQIEVLVKLHQQGHKFYFIEQPIIKTENKFAAEVARSYYRRNLAQALNLVLGEDKTVNDYFTIINILTEVEAQKDNVIFYPLSNNLEQPMNDETAKNLKEYYQAPRTIGFVTSLYYKLSHQ